MGKLSRKVSVPPRKWWKRFEPVYVAAAGIVLAVGLSQQTSPSFLMFSLAVVWSVFLFAIIDRNSSE